jgi:hypothetical protein
MSGPNKLENLIHATIERDRNDFCFPFAARAANGSPLRYGKASPDVLHSVLDVPTEIESQVADQLQTQAAGAQRPIHRELRKGVRILVGDVENERVLGSAKLYRSRWPRVRERVRGEFSGNYRDLLRHLIEISAVR